MNNRAKKQNVLICNAFKKLKNYLKTEGYHEMALNCRDAIDIFL